MSYIDSRVLVPAIIDKYLSGCCTSRRDELRHILRGAVGIPFQQLIEIQAEFSLARSQHYGNTSLALHVRSSESETAYPTSHRIVGRYHHLCSSIQSRSRLHWIHFGDYRRVVSRFRLRAGGIRRQGFCDRGRSG